MKKTNISALLLSLIGIIFLFVSLVAGLITGVSEAFLTGLGFFAFNTVVAFVLVLAYGNRKTTIRDVFFNAPIYYIGTVYFAVSGLVSVLHMLTGLLSVKWLVIVQLLVLGVFAVYFIFSLAVKGNAGNVSLQVAEKNAFIRDMHDKVSTLATSCGDRDTKIKLEALAEDFQYSKPAFSEALLETEDLIRQKVAVLADQLETKDLAAAQETVAAVKTILIKRNEMAGAIR